MDLDEIRRKRLRQLIHDPNYGMGHASILAGLLHWPPTDVSRYLGYGPHSRRISEKKARGIEAKLELPKYWMDEETGEAPKPEPWRELPQDVRAKVLTYYSRLTDDQAEDIMGRMRAMNLANELVIKQVGGKFRTVTKERAAERLPPKPYRLPAPVREHAPTQRQREKKSK